VLLSLAVRGHRGVERRNKGFYWCVGGRLYVALIPVLTSCVLHFGNSINLC
jgi:hypothetical protein